MSIKYVLDGHTVVACTDLMTWARWLETGERVVAKTRLSGSEVSTVFLGLDHRFGDGGPPIVFETLVFGGVLDGDGDRYSTWEEAEKGHAAFVEKVKAALAASFAPIPEEEIPY